MVIGDNYHTQTRRVVIKMKEYYVQVPIAGFVNLTVEADCEDTAKEKAMEMAGCMQLLEPSHELIPTYLDNCSIHEWSFDTYDKCIEGNVCYLELNQIEIELED